MDQHPVLQMQIVKYGGVIQSRSHTASNWQGWDLNTLIPKHVHINTDAVLGRMF